MKQLFPCFFGTKLTLRSKIISLFNIITSGLLFKANPLTLRTHCFLPHCLHSILLYSLFSSFLSIHPQSFPHQSHLLSLYSLYIPFFPHFLIFSVNIVSLALLQHRLHIFFPLSSPCVLLRSALWFLFQQYTSFKTETTPGKH